MLEGKKLKDLIDEYISYMDRKDITKNSYKKILYQYLEYTKTLSIIKPKRNDVIKYKEYLLTSLSSSSVQKHIVVLRGFYRYCKLNEYYDDITYGIRGCKIYSDFKRKALSIEASKQLLRKAKMRARTILGKRNYALVALLLTTGLRSIEVERANVDDIDIIGGEYVLFVMGKGQDAKDQYVKLSQEVYDIIQDYLLNRMASTTIHDEEALFLTHNSRNNPRRLSTKVIRSAVKELLTSIGYGSKAYSVHSLRHSFATTALLEGATLLETKEALRHKDVSTTQIYAHTTLLMQSNTHKKVSDALFSKEKN